MKKSIQNLGEILKKNQQKKINGGQVFNGPCFEWCACPHLQQRYWKPLNCSCNNGNSGGGNNGGNGGNTGGSTGPV